MTFVIFSKELIVSTDLSSASLTNWKFSTRRELCPSTFSRNWMVGRLALMRKVTPAKENRSPRREWRRMTVRRLPNQWTSRQVESNSDHFLLRSVKADFLDHSDLFLFSGDETFPLVERFDRIELPFNIELFSFVDRVDKNWNVSVKRFSAEQNLSLIRHFTHIDNSSLKPKVEQGITFDLCSFRCQRIKEKRFQYISRQSFSLYSIKNRR